MLFSFRRWSTTILIAIIGVVASNSPSVIISIHAFHQTFILYNNREVGCHRPRFRNWHVRHDLQRLILFDHSASCNDSSPSESHQEFASPLPFPSIDLDHIRRRQLLLSMLATMTTADPSIARCETLNDSLVEQEQIPLSNRASLPIVPPLDDRQYQALTLENGLRVFLCSDNTSKDLAAAMDVHVGACSDPKTIPGLAHFNEQ
jgi:hypothetical protein